MALLKLLGHCFATQYEYLQINGLDDKNQNIASSECNRVSILYINLGFGHLKPSW